jgi:hypothetical protein
MLFFLTIFSCKKQEFSPEGPTDVRVRNRSNTLILNNVNVDISDSVKIFGNLNPGSVSDYQRFHKAYPKSKITAEISVGGSMQNFSTGPVDYTYLQYIGQDRITYEVDISDMARKELRIINLIIEEPLVLK